VEGRGSISSKRKRRIKRNRGDGDLLEERGGENCFGRAIDFLSKVWGRKRVGGEQLRELTYSQTWVVIQEKPEKEGMHW